MNVYLLKRDTGFVYYNEYEAHLIAAESEMNARKMASERANEYPWLEGGELWLNREVTHCIEMKPIKKIKSEHFMLSKKLDPMEEFE